MFSLISLDGFYYLQEDRQPKEIGRYSYKDYLSRNVSTGR